MKAIALTAPRSFAEIEMEMPRVGPGQVLVRVGLVGICGSDMHLFRHGDIGGIAAPYPWVAGHECMGTVVEVGEGVDPTVLNQRVAVEPHLPCGHCAACERGLINACMNDCFLGVPPRPGALVEHLLLEAQQVEPISDRISDEEGVLLEPLAIALHAVNLIKPQPGETVAIVGTGVLGTCVLVVLKQLLGMEPICVDLVPDRLALASNLGASTVVQAEAGNPQPSTDAIKAATAGVGADRVFECAGVPDTYRVSADAAAPGAHVGLIGIPDGAEMPLPASSTRRKALTIRMIRRSLHTLRPCIEHMEAGRLSCRSLATHTVPASATAEAFALVDGYRDKVLKALIDMRR